MHVKATSAAPSPIPSKKGLYTAPDISKQNKRSMLTVFHKLLNATYYLAPSNTHLLSNQHAAPFKPYLLHGRDAEVKTVLEFLLLPLMSVGSSSTVNSPNVSHARNMDPLHRGRGSTNLLKMSLSLSAPVAVQPYFSTQLPTRMASLSGSQGIGKHSIISAITQQLQVTAKLDGRFNMHVFRTASSSFHLTVPFHTWKGVFREMLCKVYRHVIVANSPVIARVKQQYAQRMALSTGMREVLVALDYVFNLLPPAMMSLRPLLSAIAFIPSESGVNFAHKLNGHDRTNKTCELLCAIFSAYPLITKQLSLFEL
jgi:hypothetical protein